MASLEEAGRSWSTRTHKHVLKACEEGGAMIERLAKLSAQVYSVAHTFPTFAGEVPLTEYGTASGVPNKLYFVPHARALIFYRSVKAGVLLGMEQGSGFVIARLGGPTSNKWSAPAFVRVTGVEFGLVAGMDRAETLVGVMSERAFEALLRDGAKFNVSSNWNFEITPLESDKSGGANPSWIFNADYTSASVSRGVMADVALQGTRIFEDAYWNQHCYGSDVGMEEILRGEIAPPPELKVMPDKLQVCCAPEMAGISEALRHSMFGLPSGTGPGTPAAAATAFATAPVAAEPAGVAAVPVEAAR